MEEGCPRSYACCGLALHPVVLCKHGDALCVSTCQSVCLPVYILVSLPVCMSTSAVSLPALQACAEEHQRYLLFSSLLRHTSSSSMGLSQQAALVDLAAAEGRALEGGLASPALVLAVKVPPVTDASTL